MRSRSQGLAVAVLLLCFVLVSSSITWARPVHGPVPASPRESSVVDDLFDWILRLLGLHPTPHQIPDPGLPHVQDKEGPQMDPNGNH